ncbi:hypothetical protein ACHHYP_08916 [Achlya hypogyna]|uniref:NADPH-dependent FMN reductase-like domain-containing protein n=1 Tax=Achlya hypogyna TaxID=1202772 RepID=A0A1V9ZJV7_ACHHY|nr:hypothetical protein ACHHYP_08916 [Achlya hypogyna]
MYGAVTMDGLIGASKPPRISRALGALALVMSITTMLCTVYLVTATQTILQELRHAPAPAPVSFATTLSEIAQNPDKTLSSHTLVNETRVLVVHAGDAWLERFGQEVARGANSVTSAVKVLHPDAATIDDVLWADALLLGSNVYNANVDPVLMAWMNQWPMAHDLSSKVGGAFAMAGGLSSGEEIVMLNLLHSLMIFKFIVVGGDAWTSAFGASAVIGEGPFHEGTEATSRLPGAWPAECYRRHDEIPAYFLRKAFGLGQRVASVAAKLRHL